METKKTKSNKRGAGEGTIYKDKAGYWRAELMLGYGPDGKPLRWRTSGKLRREVAAALAQAIEKHRQNTLVVNNRQTVAEYLARWLEDVAKPHLYVNTYQSYCRFVRLHINPTLGNVRLQKVTPQHVLAMQRAIADKGLSPYSVRHARSILHRALRDAERMGLVGRNAVDLCNGPRIERQERQVLTPEQARAVLAAAEGTSFEALYVLALTTAFRRGELLGLKWADIDFTTKSIALKRALSWVSGAGSRFKDTKTHKHRGVALTDIGIAALKRHRARQLEQRLAAGPRWEDNDLVFTTRHGKPLQPWNVLRDTYEPLLKAAGVPRVRFHDLRHTTASLLVSLGVPLKVVQEILGHSQQSTTADTYSHVLPGLQRDAMDRLNQLLTP